MGTWAHAHIHTNLLDDTHVLDVGLHGGHNGVDAATAGNLVLDAVVARNGADERAAALW